MRKKDDICVTKNEAAGETDIYSSTASSLEEIRAKEIIAAGGGSIYNIAKKTATAWPKAIVYEEKVGDKYVATTYEDFITMTECFARSLIDGKFCPELTLSGEKMKFLGWFLDNRPEALIADMAAYAVGAITVSLFEVPTDHSNYLINQCPFDTVVVQPNLAKVLIAGIASKSIRLVKNFVMTEELDMETVEKGKSLGVSIYTLKDLIDKGKKLSCPFPVVGPMDFGQIMYTSGSTGKPKGALIRHHSAINFMGGFIQDIIMPEDSFLANIFFGYGTMKLMAYEIIAKGGKCIFFGSDVSKTFEIIREKNVTVALFPPRLLHKAYPAILESLNLLPPAQKEGVLKALQAKIQFMKEKKELTHPEYDKYLAGLKLKLFGTKLRQCYFVGSSIGDEVLWFFRAILGVPFQNLYGLTEIGGWCSLASPFAPGNNLGTPLGGYEIKLRDWQADGYTSKDVIDGKLTPRGEILIRSKWSFVGYLNDPEKTAEMINSEGWVQTKDIAQIDTETLEMTVIDRANNIKRIGTIFVSTDGLEKAYEESGFIMQMYVHVDSTKTFLVAIAHPNSDNVLKWAKAQRLTEDFGELCKSPVLIAEVLADLRKIADKKKHNCFERIERIHFTPRPFTQVNGLMTITYKLRRLAIEKAFEKEIKEMFESKP